MLGLDPSIHAKALCLQMFFGRMPSPFRCKCGRLKDSLHQKKEAGLSPGLFLYLSIPTQFVAFSSTGKNSVSPEESLTPSLSVTA